LFSSSLFLCQNSSESETRLIPSFILDACQYPECSAAILEVVRVLGALLEQQLRLSVARSGFFSPLITQNLLQFFAEYISTYVDPDTMMYNTGIEQSSRALALHGTEFNDTILLLCQACQYCVVTLPLEEDLVLSCGSLIKSLASMHHRVGFVVGQQTILEIFSYAARVTDELGLSTCRLSPNGLTGLIGALACLAGQEGCSRLFVQLCTAAQNRLGHISALLSSDPSLLSRAEVRTEVLYCISTLNGIARSPLGCEKQSLYQTFNRGFDVFNSSLENIAEIVFEIGGNVAMMRDKLDSTKSLVIQAGNAKCPLVS
jgi:hypothetical protein